MGSFEALNRPEKRRDFFMRTPPFSIHDPMFDSILTLQEITKSPKPESSYILHLENERQGLVYYGSHHSRDPKNLQFAEIEALFSEWILKYELERCVALIENAIPPLEATKGLMIEKYGESGMVTWLARNSGVACECPEKTTDMLNAFVLEKGYSSDDLLLWIFLNSLFNRTHRQPTSDEAIESMLKTIARAVEEADTSGVSKNLDERTFDTVFLAQFRVRLRELAPDFSLPASIREFKNTNTQFNWEEIKKLQDPTLEGTVLNEIGTFVNHARDRYIVAHMLERLREGKSVFAAFGWNHVVAQEAFLRKYFENA